MPLIITPCKLVKSVIYKVNIYGISAHTFFSYLKNFGHPPAVSDCLSLLFNILSLPLFVSAPLSFCHWARHTDELVKVSDAPLYMLTFIRPQTKVKLR